MNQRERDASFGFLISFDLIIINYSQKEFI